ncbi:ribonuclease III [Ignavigranum ruoffiae]|uniref:Ribonuclease 3 n=1 Tax=Ignavigranum ruoffiae TaxID=89093 RepID=A0A1H8Z0M3_9LACT|nr:ribonuclease III [Ignavigranum ruoffiae]UPQ85434.1 ribonuclease III [Ignavigranum ruoffiae]SEP57871.1 RNAse III [Ignavigranum ruoffiae]
MTTLLEHLSYCFDIDIKQAELYITAFQHTSFVHEQKGNQKPYRLKSNERLEYLGDAVLELIVSQYLFTFYPDQPEGFLSRTRAALVQEESLAKLAKQLKFDQFIQLGKGERANGGQYRFSILSDCFEAVLGAIYLDQGFACVERILVHYLLENHQAHLQSLAKDYKTLLQEKLQQQGNIDIEYRLEGESGPDHARIFEMALYVNNEFKGRGQGRSKKQAEMAAAKAALMAESASSTPS